jgi:meiotic recombination protein SPO11
MITGKGYPDVATRCFLKHLSDANRGLPVYSLVDCNPDGLCISNAYKFGSSASFLLNQKLQPFAVSELRWLGIFPSEAYASQLYTKPNFTKRDVAMMKKIKTNAERNQVSEQWMHEVYRMESVQHKVDIEHFSKNCNLADYVSKLVLNNGGLAR